MSALGNPEAIDGPTTSNFFEAKRDNVRAAIPQAVMAVASHCAQHGYALTLIIALSYRLSYSSSPFSSIPVLRGCTTSGEQWIFFVYATNENGGGHVACSDEFSLGEQLEGLPLILGLLTDWVRQSLSNFGESLTNHSRWITLLNTIKNSLRTNENSDCDSCPVLFVFLLGQMAGKDS